MPAESRSSSGERVNLSAARTGAAVMRGGEGVPDHRARDSARGAARDCGAGDHCTESDQRIMSRPTITMYARVFLPRSENFLYHQLKGITRADVTVVAQRGKWLDEFPVERLYLAQPDDRLGSRWAGRVRRRLLRDRGSDISLPRYVQRLFVRHLLEVAPKLVYCMFGWNACQILDVVDALRPRTALAFHAAGSDITSAHALGEEYVRKLRRVFDRATLILCGSSFLEQKLADLGAPAGKVVTHYIGVDLPRPPAEPRGGSFVVLAASRLTAVKGVPHTIRAFARSARVIPGAVLKIVGDGQERTECETVAREEGVADQVRFLGEQPQHVLFNLMRTADIFVQHNVRSARGQEEGLGGTIIEAAAHGLPVVGTRSGGVPEAVVDGQTGVLVDPGDEAAMAAAIVGLHEDAARRVTYGKAARRLMAERFDRRRQNARLEELLLAACS